MAHRTEAEAQGSVQLLADAVALSREQIAMALVSGLAGVGGTLRGFVFLPRLVVGAFVQELMNEFMQDHEFDRLPPAGVLSLQHQLFGRGADSVTSLLPVSSAHFRLMTDGWPLLPQVA